MKTTNTKSTEQFCKKIGGKEKQKLKALRENKQSVWFGLGMFGMIGWSIVVPALLGASIGIWLDKKYSESFSWTLTFFIVGLCFGCVIAWHWVSKEDKEMNQTNKGNNE
jgi:ATP synthase protein I